MIDCYSTSNKMDENTDIQSTLIFPDTICSDKTKNPLFSIIIPTYSRPKYIQYSIESAVNQEFDDYEIIIVENGLGANGQTCEDIVKNINSPKISFYRNVSNIGMCGNWNRATDLARGKYIIMLHDDDVIDHKYLKMLFKVISSNPEANVIGLPSTTFSTSGNFEFSKINNDKDENDFKISYLKICDIYFNKNISIVGMTYKKSTLLDYGGFKEELYPNEDTFFIAYNARINKVINIISDYSFTAYRQLVNLSQSENTMNKIITYMHFFRTQSYSENACTRIANKGEKYILHDYISGAEKFWNMKLNYAHIFRECGYQDDQYSWIEKFLFKFGRIVYRLSNIG